MVGARGPARAASKGGLRTGSEVYPEGSDPRMAGRGPAPKPADRRVGAKAKETITVLPFVKGTQPPLPKAMPNTVVYNPRTGEHEPRPGKPWPAMTKAWWRRWGASSLTDDFADTDWSELLDTAILHGRLWAFGDVGVMPELRVRVAKVGATKEDRARLRIAYAHADQAEAKNAPPVESRWAALRVVD